MPISGQPGIGKGGPARIRVGEVVSVVQVTPPSIIGRILGDTGETDVTTTQLFEALGRAKGSAATPSTGLKGSSADAPFGKAPAVPGPLRATEKPSGPIHVSPPALLPGRTFRRPSAVFGAPPPASRPVNQGFPLRFFPKVAEPSPSLEVLRQLAGMASERAGDLIRQMQAVRQGQLPGDFAPMGTYPVDREAATAAEFAMRSRARLEEAEAMATRMKGEAPVSEALKQARKAAQRRMVNEVTHAGQSEVGKVIKGIVLIRQLLKLAVAAPRSVGFSGAFPSRADTLEELQRRVDEIKASRVGNLGSLLEGVTIAGVGAMGPLQISTRPSNLAPSQRGVRPGGIVLLTAAPPPPAPPPLSIGDLVPPGKLGGSTSQDTVVGPDLIGSPGKLGGGPTFTTRVRDAHFPDLTERR